MPNYIIAIKLWHLESPCLSLKAWNVVIEQLLASVHSHLQPSISISVGTSRVMLGLTNKDIRPLPTVCSIFLGFTKISLSNNYINIVANQ